MEAMTRTIPLERRSKTRYPIELSVKYRTLGRYHRLTGMGRTSNLSSSGMLIMTEQRMAVGARLELNIEWPSLLDGLIPLQVVAVGKVVRSSDCGFAFAFTQYQFRTLSRKLQSTPTNGWEAAQPMIRSAGA